MPPDLLPATRIYLQNLCHVRNRLFKTPQRFYCLVSHCVETHSGFRLHPAAPSDLPDDITEPDAQVVARHTVHSDAVVPARVVGQDDAHRLATFPPPQHHRVASEELQLIGLILGGENTHTRISVLALTLDFFFRSKFFIYRRSRNVCFRFPPAHNYEECQSRVTQKLH